MSLLSLGQRITYYRKKAKISQKNLAEVVGMSPNAVNGYEKDKREPNILTLINLAKALNVTTDALLGVTHPGSLTAQNSDERAWLCAFRDLKSAGQDRALEYIAALKELPYYAGIAEKPCKSAAVS